jgi:N-acetylglucosaminyl-diphospho-decaprenol L-rhamnosyltransferase
MRGASPPVDAVIVTYQSARLLPEAVASLRASGVSSIQVVDNASTDGSADVARALGCEVIVHERNLGFANGVNAGLSSCRREYVLLMNPDARLRDRCLERLVATLAADRRVVAAGPLLVSPAGEFSAGARRFSTPLNRTVPQLPLLRRLAAVFGPEYCDVVDMARARVPRTVDYLWGAALLVRRDFLQDGGGLDGQFFMYSEDEDLGLRARAAHRSLLLVPDARAEHVGGASSGDARELALARQLWATELLFAKWRGWAVAGAFGVMATNALRCQCALHVLRRRPMAAQDARHAAEALRALREGRAT